MRRRAFLGAIAGAVGGSVAGCTWTQPCAEGVPVTDLSVSSGTLNGFELHAGSDTVPRGGDITVELVNTASDRRITGVKSKYAIHWQTGSEWRNVFYPAPDSDQPPAYISVATYHDPGEGFRWDLRFTPKGLAHEIDGGTGALAVCDPLPTGTYRFVYWGVGGDGQALGARFTVAGGD